MVSQLQARGVRAGTSSVLCRAARSGLGCSGSVAGAELSRLGCSGAAAGAGLSSRFPQDGTGWAFSAPTTQLQARSASVTHRCRTGICIIPIMFPKRGTGSDNSAVPRTIREDGKSLSRTRWSAGTASAAGLRRGKGCGNPGFAIETNGYKRV